VPYVSDVLCEFQELQLPTVGKDMHRGRGQKALKPPNYLHQPPSQQSRLTPAENQFWRVNIHQWNRIPDMAEYFAICPLRRLGTHNAQIVARWSDHQGVMVGRPPIDHSQVSSDGADDHDVTVLNVGERGWKSNNPNVIRMINGRAV
jgi:hypothetical protein